VTINDNEAGAILLYNEMAGTTRLTDQEGRRMKKSGLLALVAGSVLAVGVMASEKPSDEYVKSMKETNVAAQSLRKDVEAKDYDAVARDAATLKALFAGTEEFWTKRNAEDAVAAAKAGGKAAADLESAAKARNGDGVAASAKAVNGTCKTCHDAHRERLPDGTSEIK
jgi:cytochrome c556